MKALTIREPWASLLIEGEIIYCFFKWKTDYRGRILIHAGNSYDIRGRELFDYYDLDYAKGCIIGEASIEDCFVVDKKFEDKLKGINSLIYGGSHIGEYVWKFRNVVKYRGDYPVKGNLDLWNYDNKNIFENQVWLMDGSYLYYDEGRFDGWCVYEVKNGKRSVPFDVDYFRELEGYAKVVGRKRLYDDFFKFYIFVDNCFHFDVVGLISELVVKYDDSARGIFRIFVILYMTMVSEENKRNTRLGKRIKRLGVYYLLILGYDPVVCARFMDGKDWEEIDRLCIECGI